MGFKIAILGKMCSGKTTLCNQIDDHFTDMDHITIIRLSFARKVKDIAIDLFGMSSDPKKKNRQLTVDIGTKMREIDPNVWANYTVRESDKHEYVLIDDLRTSTQFASQDRCSCDYAQGALDFGIGSRNYGWYES